MCRRRYNGFPFSLPSHLPPLPPSLSPRSRRDTGEKFRRHVGRYLSKRNEVPSQPADSEFARAPRINSLKLGWLVETLSRSSSRSETERQSDDTPSVVRRFRRYRDRALLVVVVEIDVEAAESPPRTSERSHRGDVTRRRRVSSRGDRSGFGSWR